MAFISPLIFDPLVCLLKWAKATFNEGHSGALTLSLEEEEPLAGPVMSCCPSCGKKGDALECDESAEAKKKIFSDYVRSYRENKVDCVVWWNADSP